MGGKYESNKPRQVGVKIDTRFAIINIMHDYRRTGRISGRVRKETGNERLKANALTNLAVCTQFV